MVGPTDVVQPWMPRAARDSDAWLCHVSVAGGSRRRGCAAAGVPECFNGPPGNNLAPRASSVVVRHHQKQPGQRDQVGLEILLAELEPGAGLQLGADRGAVAGAVEQADQLARGGLL